MSAITEAVLNRYMGVRTLAQRATGAERETAAKLQREMEDKYSGLADLVAGIDGNAGGGGAKKPSAGSMFADFLASPLAREVLDAGMNFLKSASEAQKADDKLVEIVDRYFEIEGGITEEDDDADETHFVAVQWTPKDHRGMRRKFKDEAQQRAICVAVGHSVADALFQEVFGDEDADEDEG